MTAPKKRQHIAAIPNAVEEITHAETAQMSAVPADAQKINLLFMINHSSGDESDRLLERRERSMYSM